MLNRIFKTIFILSLCIGISLPANAGNVSVSDGSAFITKSEMSYQLNNLSNRMTQLENSLDSKIDSLVSSYLTRNGIWNGAVQDITNQASAEHSFIADWGSGNIGTKYLVVTHFDEAIILNTTKSGLLFGSFSYGNKHKGIPNNWYYGGYMSSAVGWVWDQNCSIQLSFFEKDSGATTQSTGNIKTVVRIADSLGIKNWYSGSYTLIAVPMPNWNVIPFQFFVEKNKEIWWKWTDSVSLYQSSGFATADYEGSTMRVELGEIRVY